MDLETFDKFSVYFFFFLALVLFYQSWMNLVEKRLSKFSIDALMFLYLRVFRGKEYSERAKGLLSKEPSRMRTLGIFSLCGAITAIYVAIDLYLKFVQ
jgi:hypothetical protein